MKAKAISTVAVSFLSLAFFFTPPILAAEASSLEEQVDTTLYSSLSGGNCSPGDWQGCSCHYPAGGTCFTTKGQVSCTDGEDRLLATCNVKYILKGQAYGCSCQGKSSVADPLEPSSASHEKTS